MKPRMQQKGVSLIELMVGLVIGLVALLVIGQTMAVFEGEKRTSTGGADAQTNGYTALLAMERDIRAAGTGMVGPDSRLACEGATFRQYNTTQENPASSPPNGFLPPVRIISGGSGSGGDAMVLVRPNVGYAGALPSILATAWGATAANCASQAAVQPATANDPTRGLGDLFLIAPARHRRRTDDLASSPPNSELRCYVVQLSATAVAGGTCPANYLSFDTATTQPYNNGVALPGIPAAGDLVIGLGPSPYIRYGVEAGRLMLVEQLRFVNNGNAYVDNDRLMDDIVYVAAQYGIDTDCVSTTPAGCSAPAHQSVDRYVNPTGLWADTALSPARFVRIKAIRLAVVARSPQYNKDLVSPATIRLWQPINAGDDPPPEFTGAALDRHFRHRVFETVIPLRNMIWGQL